VLELDDLVDRPMDLDVVSVFELVGGEQGGSVLRISLLEPSIAMWLPFLGARKATE